MFDFLEPCFKAHCPGNPQLKAVEKRANSSSKSYLNRCKKNLMKKLLPVTTRDPSHQHTSLTAMVGNFLGKLIRALSSLLSKLPTTGSQSDAGNMTPANWTDVGKKDTVKLIEKRFKVALGCAPFRLQCELLIRGVQFIKITRKGAHAAGPLRGYFHAYGNSWLNNRENDDASICFDLIIMNITDTMMLTINLTMSLRFNVVINSADLKLKITTQRQT